MKELIEELKLNRVAYLLEIIEKKDFDSKISAYKKLEKIKITKNIGIFLIQNSAKEFGINDNNGGINSSILSLCFKNYYDEYTNEISKIFKYLKPSVQNKVVFFLSTLENESALKLYVDLILKYYKDSDFIPISNLFERPNLYNVLFPKLYKALKFKNPKNNILILVNDYLNYGVVPKEDLNKNKKLISDAIIKVFNEALKYHHNSTFEYLNDDSYRNLRFFLEIATNIEVYVSNQKTKETLKKILRKKDNQLNLFIIDNYIRKSTKIEEKDINKILKDNASRYAFFELLSAYNKLDIIKDKKIDMKKLSESDFYTNFCIYTNYKYEPKNIKFIKKYNINNYDYYAYKFDVIHNYDSNMLSNDLITNYILNAAHLEKYNGEEIVDKYIGISGGYDKNKELSFVTYKHNRLLFEKINNNNYDEIIKNIVNSDFIKIPEEKDKNKEDVEIKSLNKKYENIFSYFLLSLFFIFVVMFLSCIFFINYFSSNKNINNNSSANTIKSVKLDKKIEYNEINGKDIFKKDDKTYYVLFYKKDGNKNKYYNYINEYNKRNIKFYFVNMNNKDNEFLYSDNDLNFIISKDRLLKVNDGEYEYYIDGKNNILNEMKKEIDTFIKQENQKK